MYEQVEKPKENKSRAVANSVAQKKNRVKQGFGLVDNRLKTVSQRKPQPANVVELKPMTDNYFTQLQRMPIHLQKDGDSERARASQGPPIQRVGGQKFGLQVTGDGKDSEIAEGLKILKSTQITYKTDIKTTKAKALVTQQDEAKAAAGLGTEALRRTAQVAAQTKYTTALRGAEMNSAELIRLAGSDFTVNATGVVSYKGKAIVQVHDGAAAYHQVHGPKAAGYSAIYKRHSLDGLSTKDYVSDGNGRFLRRDAYRGITPPEAEQIKKGETLTPLNATHTTEAKLGFNFGLDGRPIERGAEKGTDLSVLNAMSGGTSATVPANPDVQAYLQVRKGVGKYFSATSTPKPITSNHDGAFTDNGRIAIDLAAVQQADLLHHYKATPLSAATVHTAAVGVGAPRTSLVQDVQRGNESVLRNRELLLKQIPHDAITEVNGKTRVAFERSFMTFYPTEYKKNYTQTIDRSGLPFNHGVDPSIVVPPVPNGFGEADGGTKAGVLAAEKAQKDAAEVITKGKKYIKDYSVAYKDGWEECYYDLAYAAAMAAEGDAFRAGSFDPKYTVPNGPVLATIPPASEEATELGKVKNQGTIDGKAAWEANKPGKKKSKRK